VKCCQKSCDADAEYRVHWPGQPIDVCRPCALRATRIADAMGFTLSVDPLDPDGPLLTVVVVLADEAPDDKEPPS
jgi:hypothetical protein